MKKGWSVDWPLAHKAGFDSSNMAVLFWPSQARRANFGRKPSMSCCLLLFWHKVTLMESWMHLRVSARLCHLLNSNICRQKDSGRDLGTSSAKCACWHIYSERWLQIPWIGIQQSVILSSFITRMLYSKTAILQLRRSWEVGQLLLQAKKNKTVIFMPLHWLKLMYIFELTTTTTHHYTIAGVFNKDLWKPSYINFLAYKDLNKHYAHFRTLFHYVVHWNTLLGIHCYFAATPWPWSDSSILRTTQIDPWKVTYNYEEVKIMASIYLSIYLSK